MSSRTTRLCSKMRVIVDVLREQARSYTGGQSFQSRLKVTVRGSPQNTPL